MANASFIFNFEEYARVTAPRAANPLLFAFNQDEFEPLISGFAGPRLVLSLTGFPDPETGRNVTYICAQAFRPDNTLFEPIRPVAACPDPPGWKGLAAIQKIDHEDLRYASKFSISTGLLKKYVSLNMYRRTLLSPREVSVEFSSRIIAGPAPSTQHFVSFVMRDATGMPIPPDPMDPPLEALPL